MSYWFIIKHDWGVPILERTHNNLWDWSRVVAINGDSVLWASRSSVREILNAQTQARAAVAFLLESWNTVTFYPNSAREDWQNSIPVT